VPGFLHLGNDWFWPESDLQNGTERSMVKELMDSLDYDNPAEEERWCEERRKDVVRYLDQQPIARGRVGEWPAWHLAPYLSLWAVESGNNPEHIGWWVICGDCPTDYLSSDESKHPQDAMRAFATTWSELSDYMLRGEEHPTVNIGTSDQWPELGALLKARAVILREWASDNKIWDDDAR